MEPHHICPLYCAGTPNALVRFPILTQPLRNSTILSEPGSKSNLHVDASGVSCQKKKEKEKERKEKNAWTKKEKGK